MDELHYLLDTTVVSKLVRRPQGEIASRVAELAPTTFATSVVVAAELRYGAERRASTRLTRQLEAVLSAIQVLSLKPPADRHYGAIRNELENRGQPIGSNDLLIAAHAEALGAILVTSNGSELRRVPGLAVVSWQAAS